MLKYSIYMEKPCAPREDSSVSRENKKRKLSMPPYDSNDPKVGDIIGCSDGDVGVVVSTYHRYSEEPDDSFMVSVAWSSGRTLDDPWSSKDFSSAKNMFWIMSRA
jgi:hypothetical protein